MSTISGADLPQLVIEIPCTMDWNEMSGNNVVRFCRGCQKNVYNFAEMNSDEAQRLIEASGDRLCGRIYRRSDGTIVTSDCRLPGAAANSHSGPRSKRGWFQFTIARLLILIAASAFTCAAAPWIATTLGPIVEDWLGHSQPSPPVVGKICVPPPASPAN